MPVRSRSSARWTHRGRRYQVVAAAAAAAAAVLGGSAGSAASTPVAAVAAVAVSSTPAPTTDCLAAGAPVTCYTGRQFVVAYGIAPLLERGIDGRGQTVVLPEFAPAVPAVASDVRPDMALFDQVSGLPPARVEVDTRLDSGASPYLAGKEEVGDAEMVHLVAPGATIRIILLPTFTGVAQATAAEVEALRLAPSLGQVVAITFGLGESCYTPAEVAQWNAALQEDRDRNVTVIASSGDNGAAVVPCNGLSASAPQEGVNLPASSPLVLAVGGTSLQANRSTGAYQGETAWNTPPPAGTPIPSGDEPAEASNGGFSGLFTKPGYQNGITGAGTGRGVPDVAADASPFTGTATAFIVDGMQQIGPSSGTSAGAPFWAAIVALADQYARHALGFINPAIYRIGHSPAYQRAFHDITTGDNAVTYPTGTVTGYKAAPGWDPVTGWGSPDAQILVPLLATGG